ncbi:MAG: methylmalonyl-CoA epimerase [Deltaproteobacteria bacterium]|nr:methylmalonyl-CoA epimerase [Deltaproteobacteria bacterium]
MKLNHIGIAVEDMEAARKLYGEVMGFKVGEPEHLVDRGLVVCFVDVGGANVELLYPTDPESAVGKFLAKKGPGIHHLCYEVDDVQAKLDSLKASGVRLLNETPMPGAHNTLVAFVHPKSVGGVLTEFCQPK